MTDEECDILKKDGECKIDDIKKFCMKTCGYCDEGICFIHN